MFKIHKPEYVSKTFRLEKSLVERLAACASQNGISINALVAQCCEYALEHGGHQNEKQLQTEVVTDGH